MTSVLTDAPGGPAVRIPAPRRSVLALTRVETVRMLRHPVTAAAIVLLIAVWVSTWVAIGTGHYPVLQELDRDSAMAVMILLGGAALIVGNLAVLRAHRDGTTGLSQVLILPEPARIAANLIAPLPLAVLGAALILGRVAILAMWTPAAGRPNPYELATGPATVLLLGALGVLLGRITRSAIVAPLVLLVLLAGFVVLQPLTNGGKIMWLAPQGGPATPSPVPVDLLGRPAAAHFGYFLALAALVAVGALWLAGARGVRTAAAGVVALVCVLAFGVAQWSAPGKTVEAARVAAMNHPSQHQTCRRLGQVDYCAFAGFGPWIPAWNTVVQAVVAQVPASARAVPLTVRQRLVFVTLGTEKGPGQTLAAWKADDTAAGAPGTIGIDTQWGDSGSAANLAGQVAYRLVTGKTGEAHAADKSSPGDLVGTTACGGVGVLVVWLAGQGGAKARSGVNSLAEEGHGLTFSANQLFPAVAVPGPELAVGTEALARPNAEIAAKVQQSWSTLAKPGTTAAQAAQILGLAAPAASADPAPSTDC